MDVELKIIIYNPLFFAGSQGAGADPITLDRSQFNTDYNFSTSITSVSSKVTETLGQSDGPLFPLLH